MEDFPASNSDTKALLRSTIDRILRLQEERAGISADIAEVYKEAKGRGLERRALAAVVKRLGGDEAAISELEEITDLYLRSYRSGIICATPAPARDPKPSGTVTPIRKPKPVAPAEPLPAAAQPIPPAALPIVSGVHTIQIQDEAPPPGASTAKHGDDAGTRPILEGPHPIPDDPDAFYVPEFLRRTQA